MRVDRILSEYDYGRSGLVRWAGFGSLDTVRNSPGVDVFRYRDYRLYLRDTYKCRKDAEYGFSYRSFARSAGFSAPNYLKLVTDGQRNLTPEMAQRFAAALGLRGESADYFCDLVAFNQAATAPERERWYQRLRRYRRYKEVFRLDAAHAAYHSAWYIPAVRELVACSGFREEPHWIARALQPNISAAMAERALKVLLELGLVNRDGEGRLIQSDPLLSTGDDAPLGHHIATYHRAMLERAAEALDNVPRDQREIASLTLNLNAEQARALKQRLYEFRQELLQTFTEPSDAGVPDRVVQVNFQMFPLTRESEKDPQR